MILSSMATNKSTEKVLSCIKEQDQPVTKTEIMQECGLSSESITDCLATLEHFGLIELWTNGRTTLVKVKEEEQEDHAK